MTDRWHPAPGALIRLAAFAPTLRQPGYGADNPEADQDDRLHGSSVAYADLVDRFQHQAYEDGWVLRDFDWPAWARSADAAALRDDPAVLARATPAQIARLLTVLIRQERFAEGSLDAAFATGVVQRVVDRAAVLAADRSGG
jgi:hypothetical protein